MSLTDYRQNCLRVRTIGTSSLPGLLDEGGWAALWQRIIDLWQPSRPCETCGQNWYSKCAFSWFPSDDELKKLRLDFLTTERPQYLAELQCRGEEDAHLQECAEACTREYVFRLHQARDTMMRGAVEVIRAVLRDNEEPPPHIHYYRLPIEGERGNGDSGTETRSGE